MWGFASSRGSGGEAAGGDESGRASGPACLSGQGRYWLRTATGSRGSAMWPTGYGERGRMDAVRQMAKSKGENWGEVERVQL